MMCANRAFLRTLLLISSRALNEYFRAYFCDMVITKVSKIQAISGRIRRHSSK